MDRLRELSPLTAEQERILQQCALKQKWSNRVQVKVIRTARTIVDFEGKEETTDEAIWEAMTLRRVLEKQQRAMR
ncbi:hypothetical protein [Bacillus taeanensis]|uniref:magnesium chelatase subunit ChlI family protein n=1 Tax=Bacillus taeanensis TaxID=273032 RepID=UPI001FEAFFB4|nr:hypothetical protein [Bacillus taeanensis]